MSRAQILAELRSNLDRTKHRLDELEPESKDIYVFGAGNTAVLYRKCFELENFHPQAYLDNKKAGGKLDGIDIIAPGDVVDRDNALVLICSPQPSVNMFASEQLNALGMKHINVDEYFFALHSNDIINCANDLFDDESAAVYSKVVALRLIPEKSMTWGGG